MYQFVLVWLVIAAVIQLFKPEAKINKILFWISVAILTYMQAFRYGQGSDYWGYRTIYASAPYRRGFPLYWYTCSLHGEVGFKFLINLFTNFGISATVFYGIFGTVIMGMIIWAIKKISPYENLSLLLFYPTFYLSYVLSGVRQAMVTAIFLAFALRLLQEEKYVKYVIITLICASIHVMALFFLVLIPIKWIRDKWILYCIPVVWVGGILIAFTPIHEWLGMLPGLGRLANVEISLGGLAERTLMFGIISFLYWYGERKSDKITFLYKVYGVGYLVAIAGMVTAYGSQRITMPLKAVEIILIPILLAEYGSIFYKKATWVGVAGISLIMSLKNLQLYRVEYNAFNYPYISIWNERDEAKENAMIGEQLTWNELYDLNE